MASDEGPEHEVQHECKAIYTHRTDVGCSQVHVLVVTDNSVALLSVTFP